MATVLENILSRTKELGISPRAASLKSGLNDSFIRDLVRNPSRSPSVENLHKLAVGMETTYEALIAETDYSQAASAEGTRSPTTETLSSARKAEPKLVVAAYAGVVEAGAYRPVADFEDDPGREPIFVPRDPQFPQAALFIFDVAGDSMNDLKPHPILPGGQVLCVEIERARVPLRSNMVVIVEQIINGGLLRERSVKQIEEFEDRYEFCPRSRNPKHKPIVVPKDFKVDEGRTVAVIGIVRNVVSAVPLG